MSKQALYALFGETLPRDNTSEQVKVELNGVEAANKAVENCSPDSTIIFLKKSEYEDLLFRATLAELKIYKGKRIIVVSD
jgi:hypothetical protein